MAFSSANELLGARAGEMFLGFFYPGAFGGFVEGCWWWWGCAGEEGGKEGG